MISTGKGAAKSSTASKEDRPSSWSAYPPITSVTIGSRAWIDRGWNTLLTRPRRR